MRKNFVSISLRLTLWFSAIFFCGWVIFGTAMWFHLRNTLGAERHQTLSRRADRLGDLLRRDQAGADADPIQDFKDFAHATGNGLAEIFHVGGKRFYPSPSYAASSFPWPAISADPQEQYLSANSGTQSYSVLIRPITLDGQPAYIGLAAPNAGNLAILHDFWRGLLAWIPILLLVSSAGGYWMSRRALRPVDRITATARSISIGNLSGRLPVNQSGDELQRLTETCNDMLGRLESSVKKVKQFTADASHELRGPLSFARTVAEVALRNPQIDDRSRHAFQDIVDEAAKAAVVLEQMLILARADAEPFGESFQPIHLTPLVEEACAMVRRLAEEKNLTVHLAIHGGSSGLILGDQSTVRRLFWVILDNALKYTDAGGTIHVDLLTDKQHATVSVMDSGIGIAPEDLPHVFDRFYRADPSRSQIEGSGLGLSIAKWIVEAHHAEISASSERLIGTTFKIVFPIYDANTSISAKDYAPSNSSELSVSPFQR